VLPITGSATTSTTSTSTSSRGQTHKLRKHTCVTPSPPVMCLTHKGPSSFPKKHPFPRAGRFLCVRYIAAAGKRPAWHAFVLSENIQSLKPLQC